MSTYLCIAKRAYTPLVNDDEEVIPGNIGALKNGLQALLKEDADDSVRAAQKWGEAERLLAEEAENERGGAQQSISVDDTFFMGDLAYVNGG